MTYNVSGGTLNLAQSINHLYSLYAEFLYSRLQASDLLPIYAYVLQECTVILRLTGNRFY